MSEQLYRIKPLVWERSEHADYVVASAGYPPLGACVVRNSLGYFGGLGGRFSRCVDTIDEAIALVEAERMKVFMANLEPVDGAGGAYDGEDGA